jgi:hypothetical protein
MGFAITDRSIAALLYDELEYDEEAIRKYSIYLTATDEREVQKLAPDGEEENKKQNPEKIPFLLCI